MATTEKAIETTGAVADDRRLLLDEPVPIRVGTKVRVLILVPEKKVESAVDQLDEEEKEWLRTAAANPAFDFLKDPEEDIYTLEDGRPFHDAG